MKIYQYIILFCLSSFMLFSCEELELGDEALENPPTLSVNRDTIFSRLEYAEDYLWEGYSTLPYGLNVNWDKKSNKLGMDVLESLTDLNHSYLSWAGANELYYNGQYTAGFENYDSDNYITTKTKFHYTIEETWEGIRIGWNFIENADQIPDGEPEYIDQLKAEARMIIALHYSDMYRHYGGLPWVNHVYAADEDTYLPRSTARATLDSIVSVIDKAIPDLPWTIEDGSNWDGRFTKAAAMGLKARMLLFGASPLFNDDVPYLDGEAAQQKMVWFGSKDESLWNDAAEAAEDLIREAEGHGYGLVNTGKYRQDFQDAYYDRGNGEVLISTRYSYTSYSYWSQYYYFYQSAGSYGAGCPTQEYIDMFGMSNGLPITNPSSGYDANNPFVDRDPRLYETVLVDGDSYKGRTAELWIGGRERKTTNSAGVKSGYGLRKFLLERNYSTSLYSVVHWPYLRLAEIYLSAAEALNEVNGGPTAKAYEYVDKVRARVGLAGLPSGLSQTEFREAVLEERAKEFGFEEVRWFDLIRWKREGDFTKNLHGTNIYKESDGVYTRELFDCPSRHWQQFWSPKWYLSAFPSDEVNKEYGLVQNPGWE
ncbi:RagB/SusD family nutrient uptake outer membrane protein [Marinifilum caeruleilacunae]|uniref:RagB/SusD family nutrient uptake outer membrane protein n=1 Tax=Marinifilum caeruleilacunae TaxID=2499076 RepID=A0ABX1X0M2_9BACT|nr:RagB/SusD family nutrient uptake outer membrane protein [Marinifilum caeruleilacunae]NOU61761.1 RagB/SusD family nutrient uptake outer membrane protein [Marinifilum caeruleilacunae]